MVVCTECATNLLFPLGICKFYLDGSCGSQEAILSIMLVERGCIGGQGSSTVLSAGDADHSYAIVLAPSPGLSEEGKSQLSNCHQSDVCSHRSYQYQAQGCRRKGRHFNEWRFC